MDKGAIEPLDVETVGVLEEDLVTDDGEGQEKNSAPRDGRGEGTQPERYAVYHGILGISCKREKVKLKHNDPNAQKLFISNPRFRF